MAALWVQDRLGICAVHSPEQPLQNRNSSGALVVVVGHQQRAGRLKHSSGVDPVKRSELFIAGCHQLEILPPSKAPRKPPVPALVVHQQSSLHYGLHLRDLRLVEYYARSLDGLHLGLQCLRPGGQGSETVLRDYFLDHFHSHQVLCLYVSPVRHSEASALVRGELGGVHHLGGSLGPSQNGSADKIGVRRATDQIRGRAHRDILDPTGFQSLQDRLPGLASGSALECLIQALRGLRQGGEEGGGALVGEEQGGRSAEPQLSGAGLKHGGTPQRHHKNILARQPEEVIASQDIHQNGEIADHAADHHGQKAVPVAATSLPGSLEPKQALTGGMESGDTAGSNLQRSGGVHLPPLGTTGQDVVDEHFIAKEEGADLRLADRVEAGVPALDALGLGPLVDPLALRSAEAALTRHRRSLTGTQYPLQAAVLVHFL
mmetsp:Transcript_94606/g.216423  ORF Transcript_94606/g.216423 Transcript_94606/m.216423 type:complete len:432 (+) Transcript_94606:216-1511(+)